MAHLLMGRALESLMVMGKAKALVKQKALAKQSESVSQMAPVSQMPKVLASAKPPA
jgi:hypothetical protein